MLVQYMSLPAGADVALMCRSFLHRQCRPKAINIVFQTFGLEAL